MSSAPVAALVVALTLAALLLTSGIAKLRDTRGTRDAFDALRVPRVVPKDAAANALPWVEIALALLLLISPSGWLVPVTLALALLMLAYAVVVGRALNFDEPVTCSCFGSLGRHDVNRTMLARNVLLVGLAAAAVWFAADGGSVPAAFGDLDSDGWWSLGATAASAAVAVLVVGVPPARTGSPTRSCSTTNAGPSPTACSPWLMAGPPPWRSWLPPRRGCWWCSVQPADRASGSLRGSTAGRLS